ncbi:hypothetical protein HYW40_01810 [Candidatus Curtissbacteria bacterium]|nr:hypothetical protein [Candidatus Curtissbacteria bacterium]
MDKSPEGPVLQETTEQESRDLMEEAGKILDERGVSKHRGSKLRRLIFHTTPTISDVTLQLPTSQEPDLEGVRTSELETKFEDGTKTPNYERIQFNNVVVAGGKVNVALTYHRSTNTIVIEKGGLENVPDTQILAAINLSLERFRNAPAPAPKPQLTKASST